ncbi:MAG: hypothetical protein Q9182_005309 [Xanthomendoza sp. 2 TL-2023]
MDRTRTNTGGVRPGSLLPASDNPGFASQKHGNHGASGPTSKDGFQGPMTPSISLPTGGGAIRGIGEKFDTNPVTGGCSMTVPIATSVARDGHGPGEIHLSYSSGGGNGPFGFGWSINLGGISRKTDKGLPQYLDDSESDTFILAGAEDLVPLRGPSGDLAYEVERDGYLVRRYAPRTEGSFARIERWTHALQSEDVHWRVLSGKNQTTIYGNNDDSRIFDLQGWKKGGPKRIFSWLPSESYDSKGNVTSYNYKLEDSVGVDVHLPEEVNRTGFSRAVNRYIKSIRYGARQPARDLATWKVVSAEDLPSSTWMFEVVFDYGDHYEEFPTAAAQKSWPVRMDSFASYRSAFGIYTYRLCKRIMMFHHFPEELGIQDYLVYSTNFTYTQTAAASYLVKITKTGYELTDSNSYLSSSRPSVEFDYSKTPSASGLVDLPVQRVDEEPQDNLPLGLSGVYDFVDLEGEGLSGILTDHQGVWYYKRNLSANNLDQTHSNHTAEMSDDGDTVPLARFAPMEALPLKPNRTSKAGPNVHVLDIDGDGRQELVDFSLSSPGFYTRSHELRTTEDLDNPVVASWEAFQPFRHLPNVDMNDPGVRTVDLTGDGYADILVCEDNVFVWYSGLGEEGFSPAQRITQALHDEAAPRIVFSDPTSSIYLADMSGDGLSDILRITNGNICYWPNLGYGQFGSKVTMSDSPQFDSDSNFDPRRIRLVDIDGSGTADIIYLRSQSISIYHNHCGNSWSAQEKVTNVPLFDSVTSVQCLDLLGTGTSCLVWSTSRPTEVDRSIQYIDLTNGVKPHLLTACRNNLGAETQIHYAPSTKYYLDDQRDGKPWITRLPFPVQCVSKTVSFDHISRSRFASTYVYHHGYFDGFEREFRGFGMVEHYDTQDIAAIDPNSSLLSQTTNWNGSSVTPPVHVKTWYHTGVFLGKDRISRYLANQYYGAPPMSDKQAFDGFLGAIIGDSTIEGGDSIKTEDLFDACRSLRGTKLREEIFALDGSDKADHPYTVTEWKYKTRLIQKSQRATKGLRPSPRSIWLAHPAETLTSHYERNPHDPRVVHEIILEVDNYGNDCQSLAVAYGRTPGASLLSPRDVQVQEQPSMTYTQKSYTNVIDGGEDFRLPLLCEMKEYEITGLSLEPGSTRLKPDKRTENVLESLNGMPDVPYESPVASMIPGRRLIGHSCLRLRSDDLTRLLPVGQLESMAFDGQSYRLGFTPGILMKSYKRRNLDQTTEDLLVDLPSVLGAQGGYVDLNGDGHYWTPSGRNFFHPSSSSTPSLELAEGRAHFFFGRLYKDEFGNITTINIDKHQVMPIRIQDAVGNTTESINDYRVLQPHTVIDMNGNRSRVAFDALGQVVASAVMGKSSESLGDSLDGVTPNLSGSEIEAFFMDPRGPKALELLGHCSMRIIYDEGRYARNPSGRLPPFSATILREQHNQAQSTNEIKLRVAVSYSDGFGREIQRKDIAEAGPLQPGGDFVPKRWTGSGWIIFNNKGSPVRHYEPFFDDTHDFRFDSIHGVSPIVFYDPMQRPIATLNPDHTWNKVLFEAWQQKIYDCNDVILEADPSHDSHVGAHFRRLPSQEYLPTWYEARKDGQKGLKQREAAEKASAHHNTPTVVHSDPLGRAFLTVVDNGNRGRYEDRAVFDVEGNKLRSIDSRGRTVTCHDYDMLNQSIHHATMDSGEHWILNNTSGEAFLSWDSKGHRIRVAFDSLRRPVAHFLRHVLVAEEVVTDRVMYGEQLPNAISLNLRGQKYRNFDQAGVTTSTAYDFKGNLLVHQQQLVQDYRSLIDWSQPAGVTLESTVYQTETSYDALNRITSVKSPDGSVTMETYNEASFIEKLLVCLHGNHNPNGELDFQKYITNIDYDPKGRRILVAYGNGATTYYNYDQLSDHLVNLRTVRAGGVLQDLTYTYDAVGNVTSINDKAQQTYYFQNQQVDPSADFEYDAISRLVSATGREHLGANGVGKPPDATDSSSTALENLGNNAMGTYTETYAYDSTGNITSLKHDGSSAGNPGWTRTYTYDETSQLEAPVNGNRLTSTTVGSVTDSYKYEAVEGMQGNMTSMPHLSKLQWNFKDELRVTAAQRVNAGTPETTYYVYNGSGQRVRKVTEGATPDGESAPRKIKECVYLNGIDLYRKYAGDGSTIVLEKETFHVASANQNLALIETRTRSAASDSSPQQLVRYQHGNHLGSVSLELDDKGQVVSYEEYTPYGSTSYQAFGKQIEADKRYRHAEKERDKETGLYYYGARYYAPWIGRWISPDPGGINDGLNVYCYVRCNPIGLKDAGGMDSYDWKADLNPFQRGALWLDEKIQENPYARGAFNNLAGRGEALVNTPGQLKQLVNQPPLEIAKTLGNGVKTFVVDTAVAAKDTAYYGYKAATVGDDASKEKFAHAATDLVLNTADIVSIVGPGGVKGAAKVAAKTTVKVAKSAVTAVKTAGELAQAGGKVLVQHAKDLVVASKTAFSPALVTAEGIAINGALLANEAEKGAGLLARLSTKAPSTMGPGVAARFVKARSAINAKNVPGSIPKPPAVSLRKAVALEGGEKVNKLGKIITDEHHTMPQAMKAFFKSKGIDIHDYVIVIGDKMHEIMHGGGGHFDDVLTVWAKKLAPYNLNKITDSQLLKINQEVLAYYDKALTKLPFKRYKAK